MWTAAVLSAVSVGPPGPGLPSPAGCRMPRLDWHRRTRGRARTRRALRACGFEHCLGAAGLGHEGQAACRHGFFAVVPNISAFFPAGL